LIAILCSFRRLPGNPYLAFDCGGERGGPDP
jgi:hypothetical protein